jgi:hypothetical protein
MNAEKAAAAGARREAKGRAALMAAYREGLGLVAVAAIRGAGSLRIAMVESGGGERLLDAGEMLDGVWWCRRADHAKRIVSAANARLRRRQSRDDVVAVLAATVKQHGIALYSDEEVSREAAHVIARVEVQVESFRRDGCLKSVNQSYRALRLAAAARGEKVPPFADWFCSYKARLVREVAQTLRQI